MAIVLLVLGLILLCIGAILFVADAFQESVAWGVCVLLVPLANLVFLFARWQRAKRGFIVQVCGLIVLAGAFPLIKSKASAMLQSQGEVMINDAVARAAAAAHTAPAAPDLETRRAANDQAFAALQTRFSALSERRVKLAPGDSVALAGFNADAQAYHEDVYAARAEKAELERAAQTAAVR